MFANFTRRTAIRITSYLTAAFVITIGAAMQNYVLAKQYELQLHNGYQQALQDLGTYVDNISVSLAKGMYAASPTQISSLSASLWRESGAAKSALSVLPVYEFGLDGTYKFLSQVGDYAMVLTKKVQSGQEITEEERANLESLYNFSKTLSENYSLLLADIASGAINLADTGKKDNLGADTDGALAVSDGFKSMESGFEGYPTLIYDGPFSDHIMQREPLMLKGLPVISREDARAKAAAYAGCEAGLLEDGADEDSKMPSYGFTGPSLDVGVSKAGGYITYLINSREIGEISLDAKQAIQRARDYMQHFGIQSMKDSYYEIANGICTINFAYMQEDVVCYTDLIKVGVALDNGQIVEFDARGYLTNHTARELAKPKIGEEAARKAVSPSLKIEQSGLALIPTAGLNEVYCYEFLCTGKNGEKLLVYIGADTGVEEQILLLLITENGTLTM